MRVKPVYLIGCVTRVSNCVISHVIGYPESALDGLINSSRYFIQRKFANERS